MGIELNQPWLKQFKYDPLSPLLQSGNECIKLKTSEAFSDDHIDFEPCWQSKESIQLMKCQCHEGFWRYPQKQNNIKTDNLNQYQTFRNFGKLIELYAMDRSQRSIQLAADYFFSIQSDEGDFRGIYNNQYTPNYTARIIVLLCKAGYAADSRVVTGLDWLLSCRQSDGGWALPFRTRDHSIAVTYNDHELIQPDSDRHSSYMVTAVVLRAFAAHPDYKERLEIKQAGDLVSRFIFKRDSYPDRQDKKYWKQLVYPFCYADLISVLDSLSQLGFSPRQPEIQEGVKWFVDEQLETGSWDLKITAGQNKEVIQMYLNLAICKIFKQFHLNNQGFINQIECRDTNDNQL